MEWQDITYNTKEFHRRVKDLAADLSVDLRNVKQPKPMRRNATPKQRAIHNYAMARYHAGQLQKSLFRAAKNKERAKASLAKRQAKRRKSIARQQAKQARQWMTFAPIQWPYHSWEDLPEEVKQWDHGGPGNPTFLYNNKLWDQHPIHFETLVGGTDYSAYDGTKIIIDIMFDQYIDFDPGNTGQKFFVYDREWQAAAELDPNYVKNRRYRT